MPATADATSPILPRSRYDGDPVRHARRWAMLRQARGRLLALSDVESIASCAALETMRLVGAGAAAVTWLGSSPRAGAHLALVGRRVEDEEIDDGFPNVVAVPIRHQGRLVGILEAMDPPVTGFPPDARETLDGLATGIALAYARVFRGPQPAQPVPGGVLVGLGIAIVGPVGLAHAMWGEAVAGLCGLCALLGIAVASAAARTTTPPAARLSAEPRSPTRGGIPHAGG
jgi:hypothetical protein